jgi:WD40 repeat protein
VGHSLSQEGQQATRIVRMVGTKAKLVLVLLAFSLTVASVSMAGFGATQKPLLSKTEAAAAPQANAAQPKKDVPAATDLYGDPLPEGALARLGTLRLRPKGFTSSLAFAPVGNMLASGGNGNTIQIWDPISGKEMRRIVSAEASPRAFAFSPDGKLLAEPSSLWEAASGQELRRLEVLDRRNTAIAVAFSPKGDVLATLGPVTLRLWDVDTGKLLRTFDDFEGSFTALAFSADGRTLALGGEDGGVRLLESATCKRLRSMHGPKGKIQTMAFSSDGKSLVAIGSAKIIWVTESGNAEMDRESPSCATVSPDGKSVALGSSTGTVQIWDWTADKDGKKMRPVGQLAELRSLAFSGDGKTLAAGGRGAIRLWEVAAGQLRGFRAGHLEGVVSGVYTPDGRTVLTAGWDEMLRVWDATTGKELREMVIPQAEPKRMGEGIAELRRLAVSPDGKLVAVRGFGGVTIWDLTTGKELHRFPAYSVSFSPDGKHIACGGLDAGDPAKDVGIIRLYDAITGKEQRALRGHHSTVHALTFTPDGKTLISRTMSYIDGLDRLLKDTDSKEMGLVRVWDVETGKQRQTFPAAQRFFNFVLSPDGRTLATTTYKGGGVTLWEIAAGDKRADLAGPPGLVLDVAFSPDGRTVASANEDARVRLWDLISGKEIGRMQGHHDFLLSVAFAPDGKTLVSGSADATALIWDVSRFTERATRPK